MSRNHMLIRFSYLLLLLFTIATALDFSKDTLTAFDENFWNGFMDDSVVLSNTSNSTEIIDSILIEIDNSTYDQFQIGWVEKSNDSIFYRIFNTNNLITTECQLDHKRGIPLNKYKNLNITDKITIKPNKKLSILSPYFSTSCSIVGILVDCFGPCYPFNTQRIVTKFNGRIIFYSDQQPDTLHLDCQHSTYITSTKNRLAPNQKLISSNQSSSFNILGKKVSSATKLDAFHSLRKRNCKAAVLYVKRTGDQ
jgi:hypothetical protein